ncbi:MAG: hypothetical protein ACK5L0_00180 [Candidatus Fimivivens sp.]
MLRAMILVLTMLLVTLSSAYLGQDEQLTQALRIAKTPVASVPAESSAPPANASSAPESKPEPPTTSSQISSISPRFVMDEPLTNPVSSAPSDSSDSSEDTGDTPPDPSAHALLYPVDGESDEPYEPIPPTEDEKLDAAQSYVKELFALKDRNVLAYGELADEALSEYLGLPPDERATALPSLMEKYLPRVTALEEESDAQSEAILLKMSAALAAIGADDAIVQDARAAYERSKQEQMAHYTELFSSLPS